MGKPTDIEGRVTEPDVAQPDLTVYLIDPEAKENPIKAQTKTARDGTYAFSELKPGHRLYFAKDTTQRRVIKDVTVEPGKSARLRKISSCSCRESGTSRMYLQAIDPEDYWGQFREDYWGQFMF